MSESAAQWVRRQAREKLETYQSMASGRLRYEASDVARARRILPRVAELQAQGVNLIDAIRIAEQEHPAPPARNLDVYKQMGGRE